MRLWRRAAAVVLSGAMVLAITGCLGHYFTPETAPSDPGTLAATATAAPSPSQSGLQLHSVPQLQALVGGLRAADGVGAIVLDDAGVQDMQDLIAFGTAEVTTGPAECLELIRAGNLSDYRIPTAAAMLGARANLTVITASSDDSGLFWQGMYSMDRTLGYCTDIVLTAAGEDFSYGLTRVNLDLHGTKSFTTVSTLSNQFGSMHSLRMVAMSGNLFVSGSKQIPGAQPSEAALAELSSYVNAIIDNAEAVIPEASGADA